MGALVRPVLDAGKVKEGLAAGGAGPGGIRGADSLQADEAGDEVAAPAGGGGEEGTDLDEIVGGGTAAADLQIGGKNRVLQGRCARNRGCFIATAAASAV